MKYQTLKQIAITFFTGIFIVLPNIILASDLKTGHNYVNINGWTWWNQLPIDADVCEEVRKDFGECFYEGYSPQGMDQNTHYVVTVRVDSLIVKNPAGQWIDYLEVDSGLDHVGIVAEQQRVSRDQVRWEKGEKKYGSYIVYEAHLIVTK